MDGYDARTFGTYVADIYEDFYRTETEPGPLKVEVLASLAGPGPVLDVGCGTGRMARALARRGLRVTAVDSSEEMLDRAAAEGHHDGVDLHLADVTRQPIDGRFTLAYLLFEVLLMVGDRRAQRACLDNVSAALAPGGAVVVEISVFDVEHWSQSTDGIVRVTRLEPGRVVLGASRYDPASRRLDYQDILITPAGIRMVPIQMYPCSPLDVDRLAAETGLAPEERWSDWARTPYRDGDRTMVGVYRKLGGPVPQAG